MANMDNQRIKAGTLLDLEHLGHRLGIENICRQSVNSLGRQSHHLPLLQKCDCLIDGFPPVFKICND